MCSWNIRDFGQSKSDEELAYIAETIREFDVTAIIEVVAGRGGPEAVERLAAILQRDGTHWRYVISNPTTAKGGGKERYAYVWKGDNLKLTGSWLEEEYADTLDREPFFITFEKERKHFTMAAFHAISSEKKPEREIPMLQHVLREYPHHNIIFCADFNLPQEHTAFDGMRNEGYEAIFEGQKTTLRKTCVNDDCLKSEFDNIFYHPAKSTHEEGGIILFHESFGTMEEAGQISDHIPVYFRFSLR